jgi:ABC-2 type transport system ATP-binding protein
MTALLVDKLHKSFGKHHVLKDVSFTVEAGEIVGFIGPNGAGKSTTMKCVANLVYPDSGKIVIQGHDLKKSRRQALRNLSALIEAPGLYPNLSGIENLKLFASLQRVPNKQVEKIGKYTGLGARLKVKVSKYSMGMKQRLALGIALLASPTILVLDEPFSGLDPDGVFQLREMMKKLAAEGCGILFSSHQILQMDKVADRNIFIKEGRIITLAEAQPYVITLNYKLAIEQDSGYLELLSNLKESSVISDFQQDEHFLQISLTSTDHLTTVLAELINSGCRINGIAPLTADIENVYRAIYSQGAL